MANWLVLKLVVPRYRANTLVHKDGYRANMLVHKYGYRANRLVHKDGYRAKSEGQETVIG